MFFVYLLFAFINQVNIQIQYINAPELCRGNMISIQYASSHAGYVDCGDWKSIMVGTITDNMETGAFYRIGGAHIDNNNSPVPYEIEWTNEHKYSGSILFRGHPRKLCAANIKENLPCK